MSQKLKCLFTSQAPGREIPKFNFQSFTANSNHIRDFAKIIGLITIKARPYKIVFPIIVQTPQSLTNKLN